MTLDELADELIEIRRYVRSHPEHVKERYGVLKERCVPNAARHQTAMHRMAINVEVGLSRILCDPEILEGYLYGAAAEIRELADGEGRGE